MCISCLPSSKSEMKLYYMLLALNILFISLGVVSFINYPFVISIHFSWVSLFFNYHFFVGGQCRLYCKHKFFVTYVKAFFF